MARTLALAAFVVVAAALRPHARAEMQCGAAAPAALAPAVEPPLLPAWRAEERLPLRVACADPPGEPVEEDGEILGLQRKLGTMLIEIGLEEAKLDDIIAFVRDFTGLNIIVDAGVRDSVDLERVIAFVVKDWLLKDVLWLLCGHYGLTWIVTEEKVVLLTLPDDRIVSKVLEEGPRDILVRLLESAGQ